MADLAEQATQIDDNPGEFTLAMRAAFHHQEAAYKEHQDLQKRYAAALKEIEALRAENEALKRGDKTVVIVDGRRFELVPEGAQVTITNDWRSEPVTKNPLADSFVL